MPEKSPRFHVFDFPVSKNVRHHVQVIAPPQMVNGKRVDVQVTAGRLREPPSEGKGIHVLETVIDLVVRPVGSKRELFNFEPPLTITIQLCAETAKRAEKLATQSVMSVKRVPRGKPKLYIFTCYRDKSDKWRWQKLNSRPDRLGRWPALTAKITTLHPKDPQGIGSG